MVIFSKMETLAFFFIRFVSNHVVKHISEVTYMYLEVKHFCEDIYMYLFT